MKLTISNSNNGDILAIDFPSSLTIEDLKAYLEVETNIPPSSQTLIHNSKALVDSKKTLEESGIQDDDLIALSQRSQSSQTPMPQQASSSPNTQNTNQPTSFDQNPQLDSTIEGMRLQALLNPMALEQMRSINPGLHSSINNPTQFREAFLQTAQAMQNPTRRNEDELRRLEADPDDPANQARIMEIIRQQQIDENLQLAADISPESFVPVSMLYIKLRIKGTSIYALVDSGAAHTIISSEIAEKCGLSNLIDTRYITEARGVGKQTSKGRIHSAPVSIGDSNADIPCSFTVSDCNVDCLFGLDMLKRHKCSIDLSKNALVIGDIETQFLSELEIEKHIKPMDR